MGVIIDRRYFKAQRQSMSRALFVLESDKQLPADAAIINVSLTLAETLQGILPRMRPNALQPKLEALIAGQPKDVILDRIDILFDPAWDVDVLKLLLAVGRNRRLYLLWPGSIAEGMLRYSQPGYADHHIYQIDKYDDTYLVRK